MEELFITQIAFFCLLICFAFVSVSYTRIKRKYDRLKAWQKEQEKLLEDVKKFEW
jgi:uncharacterized membrane protein